MAVTGVFQADFSNFDKAVKQSEQNLNSLEGTGRKVESSLRLVTQSQEQLLDKIGASGGKIQELGQTAESTSGQVNTLSQSYRQFDGLLQSAGINIGPQVKGLEDLAGAAGKSATQLGILGTAGAVVGAALTGWKIGTWIGEITGATQAIEDLAASMMGLGNKAAETAAAKQDVLNRATAEAGRTITSYTEAIKINQEAFQKHADANINWRDRLADAHREVRNLTEAQKAEIAIALEAGATTKELTAKYGIHATALGILATETDKAAAAQAKLNAERAKDLAAAAKREESNEKGIQQMETDARLAEQRAKWDAEDKARQDAKLAAGKGWMAMMGEQARINKEAADFEKSHLEEQKLVEAENAAIVESWKKVGDSVQDTGKKHEEAGNQAAAATTKTAQGYQAVAQQVQITSDGVRGWLELMRATNAANSLLNQNSLFTSTSTLENQSRLGGAFSPIPGFASGVSNFEGGLARVHGGEVLANLAPGTSVFPRGQGLGSTVNNTFNLVDSESNLAKRVAEMIMRQIRAGTQLGQA